MAAKQYTWFGEYVATSFGNACLALVNKAGSGKRITVNSIDVFQEYHTASSSHRPLFSLVRGTAYAGYQQTISAHDTNASLPSGITVEAGGVHTKTETITRRVAASRTFLPTAAPGFVQMWGPQFEGVRGSGARGGAPRVYESMRLDSSLEPITIRTGQSIALIGEYVTATVQNVVQYQVSGTFTVDGSPNRTYSFNYFVIGGSNGLSLMTLKNSSASSVIRLKRLEISEVGAQVTPYFQLVPIGAVDPQSLADTSNVLTPVPTDSNHGSFSSATGLLLRNVPMLPFGVPAAYISGASPGGAAPKGYNYIHTKDFVGPTYITHFPEYSTFADPATPGQADTRGIWGCKASRVLDNRAAVVIRPGEGLALAVGAETAVVTNMILTAGHMPLSLGIRFTVDDLSFPMINISGMVSGSRYRVERQDTGATVFTGVADGTGAASYEYTAGDTPVGLTLKVRKASGVPYYKPYEVDFTLTSSGASIPVSQIPD